MKTILISAIVFLLLLGAVFWYRDFYVTNKFRKNTDRKYKVVSSLIQRLVSKESVDQEELLVMACNPSMRHVLFRTLETYSRLDLFPSDYYTRERAAESYLVDWLEFPTELGTSPEKIELISKVTIQAEEALDYFVFKYRTAAPHWGAQFSWMIGVSGPYVKGSLPFDLPRRVYSRFKTESDTSPELEAKWVHDHISQS